jgi:hypothetical protein
MLLLFFVFLLTWNSSTAVERIYYIAAEEVIWDYAPSGKDLLSGIIFGCLIAQ